MKAKEFFKGMNDSDLQFWFWQYGEGRQAAHYRGVPRRTAGAEMARRGLKPLPVVRAPRPRGYADREDSYKGWLWNWGIR